MVARATLLGDGAEGGGGRVFSDWGGGVVVGEPCG